MEISLIEVLAVIWVQWFVITPPTGSPAHWAQEPSLGEQDGFELRFT